MRELKCPKCENVFSVDEADCASIVNQVKGAEFEAEVNRCIAKLHRQQEAEEQARTASKKQEHQHELFKKEKALSEKDSEIARRKEQISAMRDRQKLAVGNAIADKDKEIAELRAAIAQKDSAIQIAVLEEQQRAKESLQNKDAEIAQLRSDAQLDKSRAELHEKVIREDYENRLKVDKSRWIIIRILKAACQHRWLARRLKFTAIRSLTASCVRCSRMHISRKTTMLPEAARATSSSAIMRMVWSIFPFMFEMKNETDDGATKHKNEEFFRKLDTDRNAKGCEYAVLVTLLEPESEL